MSQFVSWGFRAPNAYNPFQTSVGIPVDVSGGSTAFPGTVGGPEDPGKDPDESGGWVVGVSEKGAAVKGTVKGVDLDIHVPWGPQSSQSAPRAVVSQGDVKLDATEKKGIFDALGVEGGGGILLVLGVVVIAAFVLSR